ASAAWTCLHSRRALRTDGWGKLLSGTVSRPAADSGGLWRPAHATRRTPHHWGRTETSGGFVPEPRSQVHPRAQHRSRLLSVSLGPRLVVFTTCIPVFRGRFFIS